LAEAAMIACNIPANINRKRTFEKWHDWDNDLFDNITDSLLKRVREFHYTIKGFDKAPSAVSKAKDNIKNANLEEYITIEEKISLIQRDDTGNCTWYLILLTMSDWIFIWKNSILVTL
jgi:23S rRNA G2445 N2-methylase RlmL